MAKNPVYRFLNHCQGRKKSRERRITGRNLCPGNGARSALRSLRSVALSSVERWDSIMLTYFCHWTVFRCENGWFFVVNF